jgi:RNA polymerase sigma-70 factor (ECF subfamily)
MQDGDDTAVVAAWLGEHGDYLFRFALSRLSGETELARDLVQDTLLAAWQGRAGFAGRAAVRTWLTGILKHKLIDHIRAQIRERDMHEAAETDPTSDWFGADGHWQQAPKAWQANPESLCEDADFRRTLQHCLDALPPQQRHVFVLRELEGEGSEAICKACGVTATHLYVLMHRARMALRACLEFNWFGQRA